MIDWSPLLISLKTASLTMIFVFFLGLLAARWVVNLKSEGLKMVLDGLLTLPLVLPPTVAGYFLLYIFGVKRPIGLFFLEYFGVKIPFSFGSTVLAATVIAFPLMYRSARGALEQVDENLIYAARTLGFSEWKIFFKVSLPACLPGIAGGAVLAFARGLGDFGATSMIAGNILGKTRTLPLAVYSAVAAGDFDTAGKYVIVIVLLSFLAVVLLNYFALREKRNRKGKKS